MKRLALLLIGLTTAAPAWALDTYMWGVGPRIGTTVLPARYPSKFPDAVTDNEESTLEKVGFDFMFGAHGLFYATENHRLGLLMGLDLGKRMVDVHAIFAYDYVIPTGVVDFMFGAGIGAGHTSFRAKETDERLRVPNFPVRVQGGILVRDRVRAYQLSIYGQYAIPSNHFYFDENGDQIDAKGGIYPTMGLELAVFFGDFTPPRPASPRH